MATSEVATLRANSGPVISRMIREFPGLFPIPKNCTAPRVLGIDGVYIKRREGAILTDIEQGSTIDIWDAANSETVTKGLRSLADWDKVEVVTMDMSGSIKSAVQQALPNAVIVIDRYHIQRMGERGDG